MAVQERCSRTVHARILCYLLRAAGLAPTSPSSSTTTRLKNAHRLRIDGNVALVRARAFPIGVFAGRIDEKAVISVADTAVATLFLVLAPIFLLFVVFVVVLGGFAGLHSLGTQIAGLMAPTTAVWIAVNYGWRTAAGVVVPMVVPIFLLFSLKIPPAEPKRPDKPMADQVNFRTLLAFVRQPASPSHLPSLSGRLRAEWYVLVPPDVSG